jgi:hypothetical protein
MIMDVPVRSILGVSDGPDRYFDLICWNEASAPAEANNTPYFAAVGRDLPPGRRLRPSRAAVGTSDSLRALGSDWGGDLRRARRLPCRRSLAHHT